MRPSIRQLAKIFARTPLHPQWLLGKRKVPQGIRSATGCIVDIGAGDRWIEGHLGPEVRYIATDFPATGCALYAGRPHVHGDAAHLPFGSGCCDGVICLEVLEHVPEPAAVLCEISRVLKSGGNAWITTPFLYPLHDAPFDFQRYTELGLRRDVLRAGLEVVTFEKSNHSIRASGVLVCLAIAGGAYSRNGWLSLFLTSLALFGAVATNAIARLLSLGWPDWQPMSTGNELQVRKR